MVENKHLKDINWENNVRERILAKVEELERKYGKSTINKKKTLNSLDKIIEKSWKVHEELKPIKNCLENVKKWIARQEERTLKLVEKWEKKHGKL